MNADSKELLCSKCRKRVSYHICKHPEKTIIKDTEICYDEFYGICDECGQEIYVPGLDDYNEEQIENTYREKKNLIKVSQIKEILEKYNIEKRPLSRLLGFGELTITRYMDGQLPSKRYSDILIEILHNEQYMKECVEENAEEVSKVTVGKVLQAIDNLEENKKATSMAEKIALYIVCTRENITNLFLQKMLYYVKGISILFNDGNSIIPEPCEAWKYGPVFTDVYEKYKKYKKDEIILNVSSDYVEQLLTEKEKRITDYVLNTFGIYNLWFLKDLTHCEEPWINARKGLDEGDACHNKMSDEVIKEYFIQMDKEYGLKKAEGVDAYVSVVKKKCTNLIEYN